ncbi:MAG: hypothetical protein P8K66_12070 [Planctomycetota bacterium]|nr:hypothetical protein [Planctomycetota bacterium]
MFLQFRILLCASAIAVLLLSGCANSTRVIQNVGLGNDSVSLGWAGYPKDGIGMIVDFRSYRFDDPITGESDCAGGIHLGVTRKLNDKVGAHVGVGFGGGSNPLVPDGGYVFGVQYLPENNFSLGLQFDGVNDEPIVIFGVEDPMWFITIFDGLIDGIFDDDDDDEAWPSQH